ncbi:M42 family metallopeptidase [Natronomonas sp. EA1]|uniref:M42 family metallopeptidase n=1 Tax=Natronomonas sp. EA1 TaxID=3421655 RepID=UPI003EBBEE37
MDPADFEFDFDLLRELTETSGVPGYEQRVRDVLRREFDSHADAITTDAMGNLVATIEGASDYSVVVAAHMDEIGFMVKHVTDAGFLKLEPLGGWDPRILRAQRVTVHTDDGDLPGVIGSSPPHTLDDEELSKKPEIEDAYIDLGLPSEAVDERVAVGDLVTMDQETEIVGEHVSGKSVDNRVSVFALVEVARRLDTPPVTVHLAATTQEEVGLRGAEALGADSDADLAISLDTTIANDVPGFDSENAVTRLGEGAGIKLKDGGVITNRKVNRRLERVATAEEIPVQREIMVAGRTDTANLQRAGGARPAGAISFPTRYLHTPVEAVHYRDVEACLDLLVAFLESETGENDYTL